MSMIVDISFLVFAIACILKIRKLQLKISKIENDLLLTMKRSFLKLKMIFY